MEKEMTKEELFQLSDATIDKFKKNGYRKLFTMLGILGVMVSSVGVANALGIDPTVLEHMVDGIMFANSAVAFYSIKGFLRNKIAIKTFNEGVAQFKNGEMSEEEFYNEWLKGAWTYVNSNYYEIKGMVNQKAKEAETKIEDSEGDFTL